MSRPALDPAAAEILGRLGIRLDRDAHGVARVVAEDEPMRRVCCHCGAELPGSVSSAARVSHGVCLPLCAAARAGGWTL